MGGNVAGLVMTENDWAIEAACQHVDSSIFFPETGDYGPAVQVCAGCDVRAECLAYALTNRELTGVWGGLTPSERKTYRRRQLKEARKRRVLA